MIATLPCVFYLLVIVIDKLPPPRRYYFHAVCLLAGLCKYFWLDLPEKKSEDGSSSNLDLIKF